ncbi:Quinate O-hydroxycinnamoyltransferase [Handroanthus impetiginosus]|uniref:Quinate O-hydroxycinnamoyltransferase n=1 Tax=Handroanthus impetiginosus TaxID=429701 RepID=A0A2G9GAE6_9LAMI|nr:Quinate O-hydroxycinnamoyltransferase [Handroanthus impetiginosus]
MEKLSRVKVQSMLSVVSSKPIESGKIHRFSSLDQAMGLHTIHIVFYYSSNPFEDGPMPSDLDNLRVALSRLLDQFPTVTGRLTRGVDGAWEVKCNDAGVRMLQASVGCTLVEWLRSADASEERDLTVWEDMPQDPSFWSPFRIQITNFKCGGVAIGLSCSHIHADITSATMLIKSWAEVHSGQPLTHSPIFHLPPAISSPNNSISSFSPSKYTDPPPKMSTITMKFSGPVIKKHLLQIQKQCPDATPFDILVALFWSRIAHWQEPLPNDKQKQTRSLCICTDSRRNQQITYGYFGNALYFSVLDVDADKLMSGELGLVTESVHNHIEGLKRDDFLSFINSFGEERNKDEKGPFQMYGPRLTCISIEHENMMYDAMFRKGERPVHVSYHVGNVGREGLIMVMPSGDAGLGQIVMVTLPEKQVASLSKDQAVLDLEPVMVLSGMR